MQGSLHDVESGFMNGQGCLEVISGPMFSGKTEELIRRMRRVEYARLRSIVFKPDIDVRYSNDLVVSHSDQKIASVPVAEMSRVRSYLGAASQSFHVIGFDEIHMFKSDLVALCDELVNAGIRVIVAGLCEDYLCRPFGPVPELLAHADFVTKLWAVCMRCGKPASKSQRIRRPGQARNEEQLVVGAGLHYEARCRGCHVRAVVELSPEEIKADVDLVRAHV